MTKLDYDKIVVHEHCIVELTPLSGSGQVQARTHERTGVGVLEIPSPQQNGPELRQVLGTSSAPTASPIMGSIRRYEKVSAISLHSRWKLCASLDSTCPGKYLGDPPYAPFSSVTPKILIFYVGCSRRRTQKIMFLFYIGIKNHF
jgi:hypothetical protein